MTEIPQLSDLDLLRTFDAFPLGIAYCRMIQRAGQADDFEFLYANPTYHQLTGHGSVVGKRISEVIPNVHNTDRWMVELCYRVATSGKTESMEGYMTSLKDWFSAQLFCPKPGDFIAILSVITHRKEAESRLSNSESQFRNMIDTAPVPCILIGGLFSRGKVRYVNTAFTQTFGYTRQDLGTAENWLHKSIPDAAYREQMIDAWKLELERAVASNQPMAPLELKLRTKSKTYKIVQASTTAVLDGPKGSELRLSTLFDITQRKRLENELVRLSQTDPLTGLANRRRFLQVAELELARAHRHGGSFSLLMMDVDHFKLINDNHGHKTGDQALKHIARRCRATLRDIDTMGRLGGEEFAVLLPSTDQAGAIEIAERLRSEIASFALPKAQSSPCDQALGLTISIGIVTLSDGNLHIDIDGMLRLADLALYRAKHEGRNRVCVA